MTAVTGVSQQHRLEWASQKIQDEDYGQAVPDRVDLPGRADGRQSQQRTPPSLA
jgi:hypothetical protein